MILSHFYIGVLRRKISMKLAYVHSHNRWKVRSTNEVGVSSRLLRKGAYKMAAHKWVTGLVGPPTSVAMARISEVIILLITGTVGAHLEEVDNYIHRNT